MAKQAKKIVPYVPPITKRLEERGGGPLTPAASLMSRLGKREVDEEVICVVAWALSHLQAIPHPSSLWEMPDHRQLQNWGRQGLIRRIHEELLNDLGLEWKEEPMGGRVLQPKPEFQKGGSK